MKVFLVLASHFVIAAALHAASAASGAIAPVSDVVRIDPATTGGIWDGWGVSLAWWAKAFGDRDDLADAVFTLRDVKLNNQMLPGLGLNIVRYNLGACSDNPAGDRRMVASVNIQPFRQMDGFWLDGKSEDPNSSSWNWNADAKQRAMLLKARDRGANLFELFSNSPMWWMCGNSNPSGAAKASDDNLPEAHYRDFAVYLATVPARAQSEWGIHFTSVEPFNESSSQFWSASGKQEGCHFSRTAQAAILPLVRAALDQRGLNRISIAASDENQYDTALQTWKMFSLPTRNLVDRVNVHGYQGSHGDRAGLFKAVEGKPLWNSEYGENKHDGMTLARNLNLDLHLLHPTAWVYWQILDGGGWGLISADVSRHSMGAAEIKYYVLAQYTRHIRQGMMMLDTGQPDSVAAYDARAGRLVIVSVNQTGLPRKTTFDLTQWKAIDGAVTCYLTQPSGEARYARQPDGHLANNKLAVDLPAMSIETFECPHVGL